MTYIIAGAFGGKKLVSGFDRMWPDPLKRDKPRSDATKELKERIAKVRENDAINKLKRDANGPEFRSKRRRTAGRKGNGHAGQRSA
jgi:hypothetical protein